MTTIDQDIYHYDAMHCYIVPKSQFGHVAICQVVVVRPGCQCEQGVDIALAPEKLNKLRRVGDDDEWLTDDVLGRIWDDMNEAAK